MEANLISIVAIVVISYLMGSIPTAYLIARIRNVNIFEIGSGNMGGTNVARAMGVGWGILVFVLDGAKGVVAILIAVAILPDQRTLATAIAAITVVIGHNWSLFATLLTGTLRGGKGAATAFGTMLMIAPVQVFAVMCVIGVVLIGATRLVSLAVLVMFGLAALWMVILFTQQMVALEYGLYSLLLAGLIAVRFRGNIQRLLAGTERRLGERA